MVKIYTLRDPFTNQIRYVGKTIKTLNQRWSIHISRRNKTHTNSWIKSLQNKGSNPIIELLDEVLDDEWIFWEMFSSVATLYLSP